MVKPLNIREQMQRTPFVQNHTLLVLVGTSHFDKVSKKRKQGDFSPVFPDIPQAKQDCLDLLGCLRNYGVTSKQNIYRLDDDPTLLQVTKVLRLITNRLEAGIQIGPRVNYFIVWLFAGHGMVKDGMQSMLLN